MKTEKNRIWNFEPDVDTEHCGEGVNRRIMAYADDAMCVVNYFDEGGIGAMHHHPHTQITYVAAGEFEFTVDGEKKVVKTGDVLLKRNSVEHGCVCLKKGILVDFFTPMRQDFV